MSNSNTPSQPILRPTLVSALHFFGLPPELRDTIYSIALASHPTINVFYFHAFELVPYALEPTCNNHRTTAD